MFSMIVKWLTTYPAMCIYVCLCVFVYTHICIHIHRYRYLERETDIRQIDRQDITHLLMLVLNLISCSR